MLIDSKKKSYCEDQLLVTLLSSVKRKRTAFSGRLRLLSSVGRRCCGDCLCCKREFSPGVISGLHLHRNLGNVLVSNLQTFYFPSLQEAVFLAQATLHNFSFLSVLRLQGWMTKCAHFLSAGKRILDMPQTETQDREHVCLSDLAWVARTVTAAPFTEDCVGRGPF